MNPSASEAVWRALADPTRRRILDLLRERARTTGELCRPFRRLSRFAVMKHLAILESAGLVVVRRRGRERWNHLNAVPIRDIYERWVRPFEAAWAAGLLNLQRHIEGRKGDSDMAATKGKTKTDFGVARVEMEFTYDVAAKRVWKALFSETSKWWPAEFYNTAKPKGFHIEPRLGGRMYEDWGNGAGLVWGHVIGVEPGKSADLIGYLTPAFGGPAMVMLKFVLKTAGRKTTLQVSDIAFGQVTDGKVGSTREGWSWLFDKAMRGHIEKTVKRLKKGTKAQRHGGTK